MPTMVIRTFADDDVAAIRAIQSRCPQAAQWPADDYLLGARVPGGTILVAEVEPAESPQIAGFAVFHRVTDEAELRNIAVDPSHRRKGIAHALVTTGIRILQDSGVHQLFLEVRAGNQAALAFYASTGFRLLHTRPDYYRDPNEDALVMVRDITPSLGQLC